MAITSYGYPGAIVPGAVWAQMQQLLGRERVVPNKSDWEPSKYGASARTVRLAPGSIGGAGILDNSDAPIDVQLPTVGSGTRYYLVGGNREWGATNATTPGYVAGTATRAIPVFTDDPGTESFHPVALARVSAGDPTITDLVDLRAIATEPGVYTIFDDLALQLIENPGVMVYNTTTGVTRRRVWVGNSWVWQVVLDVPAGGRPAIRISRSAQYGTDLGSVDIPFYGGTAGETLKTGAADTHFTAALGGSNFQQAAAGNIARITFKTAGLYQVGARCRLSSSAPFQARITPMMTGSWSNWWDTTGGNHPAGTQWLACNDLLPFVAGGSFYAKMTTTGNTRLGEWYMWAQRIAD